MKEEDFKYTCDACEKECGQVFSCKEDKKLKWKCQKCYYKKNANRNL